MFLLIVMIILWKYCGLLRSYDSESKTKVSIIWSFFFVFCSQVVVIALCLCGLFLSILLSADDNHNVAMVDEDGDQMTLECGHSRRRRRHHHHHYWMTARKMPTMWHWILSHFVYERVPVADVDERLTVYIHFIQFTFMKAGRVARATERAFRSIAYKQITTFALYRSLPLFNNHFFFRSLFVHNTNAIQMKLVR